MCNTVLSVISQTFFNGGFVLPINDLGQVFFKTGKQARGECYRTPCTSCCVTKVCNVLKVIYSCQNDISALTRQ